MTTDITGRVESLFGLTAVSGIVLLAFGLWAAIIYFLNYFNIRGIRREVEAMKDAAEMQVHLTEKLVAALAAASLAPNGKGASGS
jgi:hypothetical protein